METIIGIVAGFALAIPLTVLGSQYLFALQRRRLALGWELISSTPIVTKPTNVPDLRISVAGRLVGQDSEEWVNIEAMRAFRVRLRNYGNETIRNLPVLFRFEDGARVVSLEAERSPIFGEERLVTELQQPEPSAVRTRITWLNPKDDDEVILNIQFVDTQFSSCNVEAGAPELNFFSIVARGYLNQARAFALLGFVAMTFGLVILVLHFTSDIALREYVEPGLRSTGDGRSTYDYEGGYTFSDIAAVMGILFLIAAFSLLGVILELRTRSDFLRKPLPTSDIRARNQRNRL